MREFRDLNNLTNLVKVSMCYKHSLNSSCIDLILTNRPSSYKVIETGLSDFCKLTISVLNVTL